MVSVFISYRREDSAGHAGRLYDRLCARYGRDVVFIDRDDLLPGQDFGNAIESNLARADIVLAVIGPRWTDARDTEGRPRLANREDFVRRELLAALAAGKQVIPILVGGADMPAASQLPPELAGLSRIQAWELRDSRFDDDVRALVAHFPTPATAAADPQSGSAASLAGEWIAEVEYAWGPQVTERFRFERDGDELLGSATFLTGTHPLEETELLTDGARFVTHSEAVLGDERRRLTHRYRVRIDGNCLQIRVQSTGGFSDTPSLKFTARRANE